MASTSSTRPYMRALGLVLLFLTEDLSWDSSSRRLDSRHCFRKDSSSSLPLISESLLSELDFTEANSMTLLLAFLIFSLHLFLLAFS